MPVTKSNTPQERLQELRASGMSWRKIQREIAEFSPLPVRTLWAIHRTGTVPKKWRKHFGLPDLAPAPVCPEHGGVDCLKCAGKRKAARSREYRDLWEMPAEVLRWRLENRR